MKISVSESFGQSPSVYESDRVQKAIPRYVLLALFIMIYIIGHLTVSVDGISLVSATAPGSGIVPRFLNAITDFGGLIVLLIFFRHPFLHSDWQHLPWRLIIVLWMGLLIISGSIGIVGGRIDLISLSVGVRAYSRLFVPFLIGMFLLGEKDIKWIFKAMLVIGFIQTPLALLQTFESPSPDMVCGLMGIAGSGRLGSFQIVCVGILLARFINYPKAQYAARQIRTLMSLAGGSAILLFPLILAESKAAFLGMGLVIIAILRYRFFSYRGLALFVGVFSILSLFVVGYSQIYSALTKTYHNVNILESFYPSALYVNLTSYDQSGINGRLQNFSEIDRLLTNSGDLLWGYGPGFLNDSIIAASNESVFLASLKDQVIGSLSFGALIFLETGYLGVLLWCIFFLYLFKQMYRSQRRLATMADGGYIFDAFIGFFIAICFSLIYNGGLLTPPLYFPFMLFSGYIVRIASERNFN
jgi:hypothetical protein